MLYCPWQKSATVDSCDLNKNPGRALWKEGRSTEPDSVHVEAPPLWSRMKSSCSRAYAGSHNVMVIQLSSKRFGFSSRYHFGESANPITFTWRHCNPASLSVITSHGQVLYTTVPPHVLGSYRSWKWWPLAIVCLFSPSPPSGSLLLHFKEPQRSLLCLLLDLLFLALRRNISHMIPPGHN